MHDTAWSSNVNPIGNLTEGDNPFGLNGIGAMLFREKTSDGPIVLFADASDVDRGAVFPGPGPFAARVPF
jgi:hypothetical protein